MPHWNDAGEETWVCQKAGHICTGKSTWVEHGSELSKRMECHGNVCDKCMAIHQHQSMVAAGDTGPVDIYEHCRQESGLTGIALDRYVSRHYGHN